MRADGWSLPPGNHALPLGGRQVATWPALLQYCVGAMISQLAVVWTGSSKTLIRCEQET